LGRRLSPASFSGRSTGEAGSIDSGGLRREPLRPTPPAGPRAHTGLVRAVGLDIGSRRIGVAVSDGAGAVATPYEVVTRSGDRAVDHARIAGLVAEVDADVVVVGLPLSLDGSMGPAARSIIEEADELRASLPVAVAVVTWDERLSTVEAERSLLAGGVRGRKRRRVVDQVAATVILQSWLDAGRPRG
jgi:putative holliday junction resolvase